MKLVNVPRNTYLPQVEQMVDFIGGFDGLSVEHSSIVPDLGEAWLELEPLGVHGKHIREIEEELRKQSVSEAKSEELLEAPQVVEIKTKPEPPEPGGKGTPEERKRPQPPQLTEKKMKKMKKKLETIRRLFNKILEKIKAILGVIGELSQRSFNSQPVKYVYITFRRSSYVYAFELFKRGILRKEDGSHRPLSKALRENASYQLLSQMTQQTPEFPSDIIWKNEHRQGMGLCWRLTLALMLIAVLMLISFVANATMIFVRLQAENNIKTKNILYSCPEDEVFDKHLVRQQVLELGQLYDDAAAALQNDINFQIHIKNKERKVFCFCKIHRSELAGLKSEFPELHAKCTLEINDSFFDKYSTVIALVVLMASNTGLQLVVAELLDRLPFKLKSSRNQLEAVLLFLIFSFNYFFIFFIFKTKFFLSIIYSFRYPYENLEVKAMLSNKSTFEVFGEYIQNLLALEIFRGLTSFFVWIPFKLREFYKMYKKIRIQRKIVKHQMPLEFQLQDRIALFFTVFLVNVFFSCQMPLMNLFCVFSILLLFYAEKLFLIFHSRRPQLTLKLPMSQLLAFLPLPLIAGTWYTIRTYGNPRLFYSSNFLYFPDQHFQV